MLALRALRWRTLRERTIVPIAVVSRCIDYTLSSVHLETKANAPLLHNQSVLSAVISAKTKSTSTNKRLEVPYFGLAEVGEGTGLLVACFMPLRQTTEKDNIF